MRRTSPMPGGQLEYAVLSALWDAREASARDIHRRVGGQNQLAYTTTATVLDRLHAKGLVTRERSGKAFVYRPAVGRAAVERTRARRTIGEFLGSDPIPAIAALVEAVESVDASLLDDLARAVNARRRRSRHGS